MIARKKLSSQSENEKQSNIQNNIENKQPTSNENKIEKNENNKVVLSLVS